MTFPAVRWEFSIGHIVSVLAVIFAAGVLWSETQGTLDQQESRLITLEQRSEAISALQNATQQNASRIQAIEETQRQNVSRLNQVDIRNTQLDARLGRLDELMQEVRDALRTLNQQQGGAPR